MTRNNATAIAIDSAYRFASKAPLLEISSSDPADTAAGVPVSKTVTLTFSTVFHGLKKVRSSRNLQCSLDFS